MLRILGSTWGGVTRLRASMYERGWRARLRLDRPVISIGALSVGGAGKTPTTALVAGLLLRAGVRPAILSRGYRRSGKEPLLVSSGDGKGPLVAWGQAGDEPFWLARALPGVAVAVASRREEAARLALAAADADVFLLDDGFQHIRVARDVDLLIVNAAAPFWADHPMPSGRLREPATAAHRADAFVLIGEGADVRRTLEQHFPERPRFELVPQPASCRDLADTIPTATPEAGTTEPELGACAGQAVFAFAGIALPDRFFGDLEAAGVRLCGRRAFADHHAYTSDDLRDVAAAAAASGADLLVTTEKDAVRLPDVLPNLLPDLPVSVWGYRLAAREPENLVDWLLGRAGLVPQASATAGVGA